jgi:hypothetical protein
VIDGAFFGGLLAYVAGAAAGLITSRNSIWPRILCCGLALLGGLLELCACILSLATGANAHFEIPAGVPFVVYSFRLDALSTYFNLILGLLAVAVSIYSLGYLREQKRAGILGFFYNLLLLSLTAVFTASNAFFFLMAWEAMALSAYCLVSFDHRDEATRSAGILYFVMSHAGTGCLLAGFLLLSSQAGSLEFFAFAGRGGAGGEPDSLVVGAAGVVGTAGWIVGAEPPGFSARRLRLGNGAGYSWPFHRTDAGWVIRPSSRPGWKRMCGRSPAPAGNGRYSSSPNSTDQRLASLNCASPTEIRKDTVCSCSHRTTEKRAQANPHAAER